jgi:hypothetical protein
MPEGLHSGNVAHFRQKMHFGHQPKAKPVRMAVPCLLRDPGLTREDHAPPVFIVKRADTFSAEASLIETTKISKLSMRFRQVSQTRRCSSTRAISLSGTRPRAWR